MRIVFMGTPDFSVPALEALAEGGHQVIAAVTQPDKPKGRGKAVLMTPVKEKALELGIPVYQPAKVREPEFVELLREMAPDAIVVVAFGQILPKAILEIPKYGCINIHASLLPKYRGAAPIQWAVIDGEKETGVTTMFMNEGLDTGDMLEKAAVPLDEKETGGSLHDKLSALGGNLILSTLKGLEAGTLKGTPQTDEGTCYAKMLKKSLGDIDWTMDAAAIERLIRGLNPWPSAYTSLHGKTLKIWDADVLDREYGEAPGTVAETSKNALIIQTGKGSLSVRSLQLEGKKRMDIQDFLRGYSVEKGTVLERRTAE
ncbi:MAG TPA: methionyl-tRNA formyltransferase [Candidatus Lachnoclostridium stercorigallinarum]|uniref:Methionyl-tRNA formyltransferase n=1 Tax=Candidatus Lachnoclostridium stercorigallinarum TaxID=2838634 RepID=A0A9D2GFC8_9FIRM|nr:methionyl-tRNA formyltransferase [Candidatus Lachnoclostridium stercorigallinarum]